MTRRLIELVYDILADGYSLQLDEGYEKGTIMIRISGHGVHGYHIFEKPNGRTESEIDTMLYWAIEHLYRDANDERRKRNDQT